MVLLTCQHEILHQCPFLPTSGQTEIVCVCVCAWRQQFDHAHKSVNALPPLPSKVIAKAPEHVTGVDLETRSQRKTTSVTNALRTLLYIYIQYHY